VRLLHFALVAALAPATLACGLDSDGLGDSPDGADAGPNRDGSFSTDSGSVDGPSIDVVVDAPLETAPPTDAPDDVAIDAIDAGDACVATAEICNDGVDNDCNGLADCADPSCSVGFVCTPPIPQGWTLLEYADTRPPSCSPYYGSELDLIEGPVSGQPASCSCGCTVDPADPGSCTRGTLKVYSNGALGGCVTLSPVDLAGNDGACTVKQLSSVMNAKAQAAALPYTPGKCTTSLNKTVPAATYVAQGKSCALAAPTGGGCATGVCAPRPASPFGVCVVKTGDIPCVGKFGKRHVVSTTVNDSRSCTACSCVDSATCANAKLTLFEADTCPGGGGGKKSLEIVADDQCNAINESQATDYAAYTYSADRQNVQCSASSSTATGSVVMTAPRTICCE
jgi:hypothetical protein